MRSPERNQSDATRTSDGGSGSRRKRETTLRLALAANERDDSDRFRLINGCVCNRVLVRSSTVTIATMAIALIVRPPRTRVLRLLARECLSSSGFYLPVAAGFAYLIPSAMQIGRVVAQRAASEIKFLPPTCRSQLDYYLPYSAERLIERPLASR